jgi:hypothetical protein
MKKYFSISIILFILCFTGVNAQQKATNYVKYMVTFDETSATHTAWVVPNYSTPNFNNPDSEEKGATAQFTIKVPEGFLMTDFKALKGDWEGNRSKIGSEAVFKEAGLTTGMEYYIIGKMPIETSYGTFKTGEPVALFSFKGDTQNPTLVDVVENNDEFVDIAYNKLSLNVASSFYSRSGQAHKTSAKPLEQFTKKTVLTEVIKEAVEKLGATEILLLESDPSDKLLVYPNPSDSIVHIKYFSLREGVNAKVELVSQNGVVLQEKSESTRSGFNTTTMDISTYSGSMYLAKVTVGNKVISSKIIKTN